MLDHPAIWFLLAAVFLAGFALGKLDAREQQRINSRRARPWAKRPAPLKDATSGAILSSAARATTTLNGHHVRERRLGR